MEASQFDDYTATQSNTKQDQIEEMKSSVIQEEKESERSIVSAKQSIIQEQEVVTNSLARDAEGSLSNAAIVDGGQDDEEDEDPARSLPAHATEVQPPGLGSPIKSANDNMETIQQRSPHAEVQPVSAANQEEQK